MKKVLPLSFLILVSVLVALFFLRNPLSDNPNLKRFRESGLSAEQAGTYEVRLTATQKAQGATPATIAEIAGQLIQYEQSPGHIVSRWKEISALSIQGRSASAQDITEVVNAAILSRAEKGGGYEHFFAENYPKAWLRLQLNALQRILVSQKKGESPIYQKRESEEMGVYQVEYTNLDRGDYRDIKKTFIAYENPQIEIDRSRNTVHYLTSKDGRLISADGDVAFVHKAVGGDSFEITLKVDFIGAGPKPVGAPLQLSSMTLANESQVRLIAEENQRVDPLNFDAALKLLPLITAATDGRDLHVIYGVLKHELQERPERAIELRNFILATQARDEGSKRQLAAAFGALAQSQQPAVSNLLARLAKDCPDLFCKDQAIVGLNDHEHPTPESGRRMIEIVQTQPDYDTTAAAVLAVGSIAYKIENQMPEAAGVLIDGFKMLKDPNLRRPFLAAMGNHGDDRYLPLLKQAQKDKDSAVRGTVFYSYRNLKSPEVNEILTAGIVNEKDESVINEGLKAVAYHSLPPSSYERIAERIAQIRDQENAKEATRLFIRIYESDKKNVGPAMALLREQSAVPTVKSAIGRRLQENVTL
ncbi:MAG: HEAT repeat domain-containing protein [Proteobacteria bacterium]|nr:MAG: HEAT repeat domain-containing protein [Pseudomonadota bacterium]